MWEYVRQLRIGVVDVWKRLSTSARVNIGLTLLATVALIIVLVLAGSRRQYAALYSGLSDPAEVSNVQAVLKEEGIDYKITNLGQTIEVRDRDVARARRALAVANAVPTQRDDVRGWDLLDAESIWTSPEQHRANQERALQGELMKHLNELDFVESSRAYINIPPRRLLARDQEPPTATVTLKVNRDVTRLDTEAVLAIVSTFGGITLLPRNVTITAVGKNGMQIMHKPSDDDLAAVASSKMDVNRQWEAERETKIREAFAKLGKEAIVMVSAKLDLSETEETTDQVLEGVPLVTLKNEKELTSNEGLPEGEPGAYQNPPEGVFGPVETETVEKTTEKIENFEPGRIKTRKVTKPGEVTKCTVSAIIEATYKPVLDEEGNPVLDDEGKPRQEVAALSETEKEEWQEIIAKAVGPDVELDDVYVTSQVFDTQRLMQAQETLADLQREGTRELYVQWALAAMKWLLALGLFLWLRRFALKVLTPPVEEVEEVEEVLEVAGPSAEELLKQEIAREVEEFSLDQPDAVAALLRAWMSEAED